MKIISGGQTGADLGGLEAGKELGLETGGWAPKGWLTEKGPQRKLLESYGLKEYTEFGYPARTKRNVMDADLTLIFGRMSGAGSKLTEYYCQRFGKPYAVNPLVGHIHKLIEKYNVKILNVAGNRESRNPGIQERVRKLLVEALGEVNFLSAEQNSTVNGGTKAS